MPIGSDKESLLASIDKLKAAVCNGDCKEVPVIMQQLLVECSSIVDGTSILEPITKPLHDLMQLEQPPEGFMGVFSNDKKYAKLCEDFINLRTFLLSLANGDLSQKLQMKGYLAGLLKTFQANLKHMIWQTKMIAEGDFTRKVRFLGDFSTSFNSMVEQLSETRKKLMESEKRFRLLATTDALSGLPNRRHFFHMAKAEFSRAKRYNTVISIIMLDIDHFKSINDTYGHAVGDMVIQAVAEQMRRAIRETDHPCRYGGEEFVVLLPQTEMADAEVVAHRIKDYIQEKKPYFDGIEIQITASLGVSCSATKVEPDVHSQETLDDLLKRADKALYAAKKIGRNRVVLADSLTE
ncbi:MAG: GGDEF domain-containing protein [Holophagales bacterium]|nr:GGDEF domain-containing protein [Holophagales bacterium]